ncbi:serine and arginine rich splicing factor 6b isoform X3 [Brienomyrus brachyistius]|uniref:serine and arginine rich splicing factor 6b isoform X3 n=1 Tax=Brienomyrus brachyistius TaxID=42636 RepID=UPI0020B33EA0|nr:serine and arginine rich splicing factor 6b isoform X3 [Brienomyrus brachyistius]
MPRVYIGRLSYHVREKDIQRFFSGYGKLLEIDLKNGYGFVEFEDTRDADDAVYELNGKDLCGERVIVEHARGPRRDRDGYGGGYGVLGAVSSSGYSSRSRTGRDKYGPPVRTEYRLIVENLSSRCSWQDLKDFMRQAGEVTYADAHKERTNEGVIEFRSYSDMRRALDKLDGTDINGRRIRLVEDKPRRRRSYSGSRSRSRSRRRSRSRSRRSSRSRSNSRSRSRSRSRSKRRSRSRSGGKSRSRSGRKSRSKSPAHKSRSHSRTRKSHSRTRKSRSHSAGRKSRSRSHSRKSRSKSRSKPRSDHDSRSRSKEKSVTKKSHSPSSMENFKAERAKSASRSPSPQDDVRHSKSPAKRSPSRSPSRSKSRSRSASQD